MTEANGGVTGRSDKHLQDRGTGVEEWEAGEFVKVIDYPSNPTVDGRFGTVVGIEDGDDKSLTVAVHGSMFSRTVHEIPSANVQRMRPTLEPKVYTAWLYARQGNGVDVVTKPGQSCETGGINAADEQMLWSHFAEATVQAWVGDDEAGSVLRVLECTESELHEFGPRLSFVRRATPIPERIGVCLACWVYPGDDGRSDGRTNVLASFLTAGLDGRVQTPVVGTCFIVRISPDSGNVVHFSREEVTRLLFFMKDVLTFIKSSQEASISESTWDAWKACYPYFEQGCVLTTNGFSGLRSCIVDSDGTVAMDPAETSPVSGHIQ